MEAKWQATIQRREECTPHDPAPSPVHHHYYPTPKPPASPGTFPLLGAGVSDPAAAFSRPMGIVKIASGEPASKNGDSCGDEDLTLDERMLLQSFPSHAISRGQMCNVPYDIYDLPELMEVLSLETWNLCLTEEDRFRLAAYLPDMDQYDFFATMKELFSGDAMFFGSPPRSFFHGLNSGFYSPEVSQARELLTIFQRRRYYHFLKSYHDGIVRKFASMNKLSRSSDMSTGLGDQVCISHNWRYEKHLPCVDLSSSTQPIIIKRNTMRHKLSKGVLKIRNGCASLTDGSEGTYRSPRLILVDPLGTQSPSFCTPPYAFAHGFDENSAYINMIRNICPDSRSSPWQWKGSLETHHTLMAESPFGGQKIFQEELKGVNPSVMLGNFCQRAVLYRAAYASREFPHEKNLLRNFGRQNSIVHQSSPEVTHDRQMNRYMKMQSLQNADIFSEMLSFGTSICPPYNNLSEQLATMRKYNDGLKLKAPLAKSVTKVEEAHRFPYTYTRKKLQKMPVIVDSNKTSTMLEDAISVSTLTSMANIKAKAIKL
ncbi:hypothetical protein ACP70R_017718 [Stipagrostis hirtigluma subsp. patula]